MGTQSYLKHRNIRVGAEGIRHVNEHDDDESDGGARGAETAERWQVARYRNHARLSRMSV